MFAIVLKWHLVSCSPCEGQELNLGVSFSLILLSRCKQQVAALFDLYEFRVCFGLVQFSLYVSDVEDGKEILSCGSWL